MKELIILLAGSVLCTSAPAIQIEPSEMTMTTESAIEVIVEETKPVVVTEEVVKEATEYEVGTDYYIGTHTLTFYCPCKKCCGKSPGQKGYGITATGTTATEGRTIGVNPKVIPYGSQVYIEGFGWYIAEDTGGGIRNKHIDIYVDNHNKALQLGRQKAGVWVRK